MKKLKSKYQNGAALYVVLVTILIAMLISVWAARSALFGEMVVGNNTDYQRAFEAAEALIQDAELDITKSISETCTVTPGTASVCRGGSTAKLPLEAINVTPLLNRLESSGNLACRDALCTKRTGAQDWWNDPATLTSMQALGARFGKYTGAKASTNNQTGAISNPILADTSSGRGGWYWIEILPYDQTGENSSLITGVTNTPAGGGTPVTSNAGTSILTVNSEAPVIYRITAIAIGLRENSRAVIQSTLVLNKKIS